MMSRYLPYVDNIHEMRTSIYVRACDCILYLLLLLEPFSHAFVDRDAGTGFFLKYFYLLFFICSLPIWRRYFRCWPVAILAYFAVSASHILPYRGISALLWGKKAFPPAPWHRGKFLYITFQAKAHPRSYRYRYHGRRGSKRRRQRQEGRTQSPRRTTAHRGSCPPHRRSQPQG